MKKKIVSLIAAFLLMLAAIPSVSAAYSDYIGTYSTANSDGTGYATLKILTCNESSITTEFMRIKNDVESYVYTFSPGTVTGKTAYIPFHAVMTSNSSEFDGTMTLELGGLVMVSILSSRGTELYTGTLPKISGIEGTSVITPEPQPSAVPASVSTDLSIVLNGTKLKFDDEAVPTIIDNFTYVPLRSVFSNMGINVYWDEYQKNDLLKEQFITCTKNNFIIQFSRTFNESGYNVWTLKKWTESMTSAYEHENIDITMLQPVIINNRSYVPLRVISEALGADVDWIDETRTVTINCETYNAYGYSSDIIGAMEDFTSDDARSYIPADYSEVVPISTPYFAPSSKFYLFNAVDMYGKVQLRIFYGGYIDVLPVTEMTSDDPLADSIPHTMPEMTTEDTVQTDGALPDEGTTEQTADAPNENVEPTASPEVKESEETTEDGQTVYTFDLTDYVKNLQQ